MVRNSWRVGAIAVALTAGAVFTGCSSSDSTKAPATVTSAPAKAAAKSTVAVTLKEFAVTPAQPSVAAGEVTFTVQNAGLIPHEFVVVKSDLAPDKLPQFEQKLVDEKAVQLVKKTEQFDGAKKQELTVTLAPGKYVLLCNVPSHYISGMYAAFEATVTK